jgi:hypothetical protein
VGHDAAHREATMLRIALGWCRDDASHREATMLRIVLERVATTLRVAPDRSLA